MGKKNIFIGLSTLLLVLLLGLSTRTYANTYRTFDEDEFKNFLYNAWINNHTEQEVESAIQTHETNGNITTIVDLINQYDYCLLTVQNNTNGWNSVEIGLTPEDRHLYFYNGKPSVTSSSNCFKYQLYYNGTFNQTWGFNYTYAVRTDFIYYGMPRYQASNNNTVVNAGNTMIPEDIFDGPYSIPPRPQPYIQAYPYYDLGSILIYNTTLPAYEFTTTGLHDQGLTKMRFATAFNPDDYKIVHYGIGYYNYVKPYDRWDLETLYNSATNWHGFDNWQIKGNAIVGYNSSFNSETNYWETLILINNKYVHANCAYVIELECIPLEDTASGDAANTVFLYLPMYLTDSHTVIDSNGELDTDGTFTNDYYLDYRTDIEDLNKQINDITGITDVINSEITDVPPVDDLLGYGLFSGDMYYLAGNLGYVNRSNHYWDFLYLYTYNLCQVLLQDSDPYFDFRLHGEETAYRIYSHDIGLPDGHPLKVFVSLFFLFGFIWIIYYQFKSIVEAIQTANMPKVAHLEDADLYFFKM